MKLFIGCLASNDVTSEYYNDCKFLLKELMKENELVFDACNYNLIGIKSNRYLPRGI